MIGQCTGCPPKKLTSLTLRHSLARKQDKSTIITCLKDETETLRFNFIQFYLHHRLRKTKNLFESKQDGLCFVMWVVISYQRKPDSFNCILFIRSFEQTFSKLC